VKTFLDSSAFAKRYVDEPGSVAGESLCAAATDLALSVVCVPELISALNRRVRERSLSRRQYEAVKESLSEDMRDVAIINLTPTVIATCMAVLEANPVRAMDALHVACAVEWGAELFVSADKRQVAAAKRAGLNTRLV
jgi:predicted nucleic acid-binding protein